MHIYQLLMKNRWYRMFTKSTVHCCFYVGGPGDLAGLELRSSFALDSCSLDSQLKESILSCVFLPKHFQLIQKAALHSDNAFGLHLYRFTKDL